MATLKTKILCFAHDSEAGIAHVGNYTFLPDRKISVEEMRAAIGHEEFAIEAPPTDQFPGYLLPIGMKVPDEEGRNIIVPQAPIEAVELIGGMLWYHAGENIYVSLLLNEHHKSLS